MRNPGGSSRSALRPLDYVFLARPAALVPLWIFYISGACLGAESIGRVIPWYRPTRHGLLGLLSMTAVLAGGYILNQIRDIETDRRNEKLFFLPRGIVSVGAARVEMIVLWALALVFAIPLSWEFLLVLLGSLVLNITYSVPPVHAKSRTPFDLIWNGLGFGVAAAAAGWAAVAPLAWELVGPALSYALAVAGIIASTTILDIPGDTAAGLSTTGTALGVRRTSTLAIVLVSVAGVLGAIFVDGLSLFGAAFSLPWLIRAHRTGRRSHRIAANQLAVAMFAILASARGVYLVALLALVFFLSRAYYRARFDIAYPGRGTP